MYVLDYRGYNKYRKRTDLNQMICFVIATPHGSDMTKAFNEFALWSYQTSAEMSS